MPQSEDLLEFLFDHLSSKERLSIEQSIEEAGRGSMDTLLTYLGIQDASEQCIAAIREITAQSSRNQTLAILSELSVSVLQSEDCVKMLYKIGVSFLGSMPRQFPSQPRMTELSLLMNLSADDQTYLAFLYCLEHDKYFCSLCDWSQGGHELRDTAMLLGMNSFRLRQTIGGQSTLCRCGILEIPRSGRGVQMELSSSIDDFLSGFIEHPYAASLGSMPPARFALDTFPVDEADRTMLLDALNDERPKHCILHGATGTGKTEFIRSVAASCNKNILTLDFPESIRGRADRMLALSAVSRASSERRIVLVIDECDDIINTESSGIFDFPDSDSSLGKEWLNLFLDSTTMTTVWITNKTKGVHESLKRRFAVSIFFQTTSLHHRLMIWRALASEYGLADFAETNEALHLVDVYAPSPADIETVFQLMKDVDRAGRQARLEQVLNAQSTLRTGKKQKIKLDGLTDCYDPASVNSSVPVENLMDSINKAFSEKNGMALLFHGKPGTGKTELAKYLSFHSGHGLLVKRASDLLRPFVGVSEQLIAAMFDEAERDERILLLDEADSFLRDRSKARNSWEVTHTNELLTQMENFKGVLIACTNLVENLDGAVLRRFAWKVGFEPLRNGQCINLFLRWFPSICLDEADKKRLAAITGLSPGDFKAVAQRMGKAWYGSSSALLDELAVEASYRKDSEGAREKIGFA